MIKLSAKFKSPSDASRHYYEAQEKLDTDNECSSTSEMQILRPTVVPAGDLSMVLEVCRQTLDSLQPSQQLSILSQLFSLISQMSVPSDFLELTNHGMHHLKEHGRSNLIYQLARCVGTMRADGSDSLLPVKRMPTGLIEYVVNFFNAGVGTKVCESILHQVLAHSLKLGNFLFSLYKHRWSALQITECGNKPCTHSLVPSGLKFMQDLCGVLTQLHKENLVPHIHC